jgi:putative flavoprotein involved in K+ transport
MRATVVVIGAGHAGLAMSRHLTARSLDHVVLERGEVAHSWRTERWDSLTLLTPNWQSRLPGFAYEGEDPDAFMTMPEVVEFIEDYAGLISAPLRTNTCVTAVRRIDDGYLVETDRGEWRCLAVVLASGACNLPSVPSFAEAVPAGITQLDPAEYRNPSGLDEGGVLVVGASATGTQLADEIRRSGRPVTLAVGGHVRLPRVYRGRDIFWWMDATGVADERYDEVDDIVRARHVPSPQLAGTPNRAMLDLNALTAKGVRLVGRFGGINGGRGLFSGSLRNVCKLADLKMTRLLNTIDEWVTEKGHEDEVPAPHRFQPTEVDPSARLAIALDSGEFKTIIWATGFRPDFTWLDVPVLDRRGRIRHDGGVVDSPGLYVLGLPFLRRRKSSFIHGAGSDAGELSDHLVSYLDAHARRRRVAGGSTFQTAKRRA